LLIIGLMSALGRLTNGLANNLHDCLILAEFSAIP